MIRTFLYLLMLAPFGAAADIPIRCISKEGHPIFTNKPCADAGGTVVGKPPETVEDEASARADRLAKILEKERSSKQQAAIQAKIAEAEVHRLRAEEKRKSDSDVDKLLRAKERFEETYNLAQSTARIALAVPVARLQDMKMAASELSVSECYKDAHSALTAWMNIVIERMLSFMRDEPVGPILKEVQGIILEREFYLSIPYGC